MAANNEAFQHEFKRLLEELNPEQIKAVEHLEGPVLVIAGPGTGKTQMLAARIGRILQQPDTRPEEILCLTYTDAGASAMRRRLLSFIGTEAYKVSIHTFHGFCHEIIQDNLDLFEKNSLDPVSRLEQIQFLKRIIDGFGPGHPLKRYKGDIYYDISRLIRLFSDMKREGWSPAFLHNKINQYLQDLPNREQYICKRASKGYRKGDIRLDLIQLQKERMDQLGSAVEAFDLYQDIMSRSGRYDFDDMINWVLGAFQEQPALMASYQERFQYVLVDEYQDTSGTQNELVYRLIGFWEVPNVFVVGDDDQSIYRFQGANVENMLEFARRYRDHLLSIVLTKNYRSTQIILDTAMSLIAHNRERLILELPGLTKNLQAMGYRPEYPAPEPRIREYPNIFQEMAHICTEIQSLIGSGTPAGSIAVIYRENRYGEEISGFLRALGIPYFSRRKVNILQEPLIIKLITILRYLARELETPAGGDDLLFQILHYDLFHIPASRIAWSLIRYSEKTQKPKGSFLLYILDQESPSKGDLFSAPEASPMLATARKLDAWLGNALNLPLQQLVGRVLQESGILGYEQGTEEEAWYLELLHSFFDFVREESARQPAMNLGGLIGQFDLMESSSIPLDLIQVRGAEQGVQLLTVHGSKGLEFDHVYLAGCQASLWEAQRGSSQQFQFPDNIFLQGQVANTQEELRRLFYVAITRARTHLNLSYGRSRPDGKPLEPSQFVEEILQGSGIPCQEVSLDAEDTKRFIRLEFHHASAPRVPMGQAGFLEPLLRAFVMNVTALNNYLKCPLQFYYQSLLRVPAGKSEHLEFGSAVHYALQKLFEKMKKDPGKIFPEIPEFLEDFSRYMERHRENFTREGYLRLKDYARTILPDYYKRNIGTWSQVVIVEKTIRNVTMEGIPLKGKLDKLEFDGNRVRVVDYKTGNWEYAKPKLSLPDDANPLGGDYWRQGVFYKILVDAHGSGEWEAVSTVFDFVEPDKQNQYHRVNLDITQEDIREVKDQIRATWKRIQNREFDTGCGKTDCQWCRFVTFNQPDLELQSQEEE